MFAKIAEPNSSGWNTKSMAPPKLIKPPAHTAAANTHTPKIFGINSASILVHIKEKDVYLQK